MTATMRGSDTTGITFQGHAVPKFCFICQLTLESWHPKAIIDNKIVHYSCEDVEQSKRDNQLRPSPKAQEAMDERLRELVRETLIDAGVDPDHWPVADRDDDQISEEDMDAFLDPGEEEVVAAYAEEEELEPVIAVEEIVGDEFAAAYAEDEELADRISRETDKYVETLVVDLDKSLEPFTCSDGITRQFTTEESSNIREFDTGANRNSDEGKLDFDGFLSPLVLKRYAEYMHKNRHLANGDFRDSDNWQKGITKKSYMKSGWRHFFDWWSHHHGWGSREGIIEALCGLMFNVMGYLHELLKGETK